MRIVVDAHPLLEPGALLRLTTDAGHRYYTVLAASPYPGGRQLLHIEPRTEEHQPRQEGARKERP